MNTVAEQVTIKGHPGIEYESADKRQLKVDVCASCGSMRSVLWLSVDRWYCRVCRNEGMQKPTMIPVSNPARRR